MTSEEIVALAKKHTIFEWTASRGAMKTTGMFSSMSAMGPCFISAAG